MGFDHPEDGDPHDECRHRIHELEQAIRKIDVTLRVPAAEYVPAIGDVFEIIDKLGVAKGTP